jgi:hypothetical protein
VVDVREAARLIMIGNRLAFAVEVVGMGEEFPEAVCRNNESVPPSSL